MSVYRSTWVALVQALGDQVAAMLMLANGWDDVKDNNTSKTLGGQLTFTPAKTATSTAALRMMTAFRLYLSAQTPHSGTSGRPRTKTLAPRRPTQRGISDSGRPSCRRYRGMKAKTWLIPYDSMICVAK